MAGRSPRPRPLLKFDNFFPHLRATQIIQALAALERVKPALARSAASPRLLGVPELGVDVALLLYASRAFGMILGRRVHISVGFVPWPAESMLWQIFPRRDLKNAFVCRMLKITFDGFSLVFVSCGLHLWMAHKRSSSISCKKRMITYMVCSQVCAEGCPSPP